jgi:hypothetical protein
LQAGQAFFSADSKLETERFSMPGACIPKLIVVLDRSTSRFARVFSVTVAAWPFSRKKISKKLKKSIPRRAYNSWTKIRGAIHNADMDCEIDLDTFSSTLPPTLPRDNMFFLYSESTPTTYAPDLGLFLQSAHESGNLPKANIHEMIQYRTVLLSSSIGFHNSVDGIIVQSPTSVDFFHKAHTETETTCDQGATTAAEGALKRCEASVQRLARLSAMIEYLGNEAWSCSDDQLNLANKLEQSRFFPAIQFTMMAQRLRNQNRRSADASDAGSAPSPAATLYENARRCGADASDEAASLQTLQERAAETVRRMLRSMSGDVPICTEEVQAAVRASHDVFLPAQQALSQAVERLAADQASNTLASRQDLDR